MSPKSLRRLWSRLPSRVWSILRSPDVAVRDKLLFVIPVFLYWILPDVMPLVPIDDAAVTALAAVWFAGWIERKYNLAMNRAKRYNKTTKPRQE